MDDLDVYSVILDEKVAVLSDGRRIGITRCFNHRGRETSDLARAKSAIAPLPEGEWLVIDMSMVMKITNYS